MTSIIPIKSPDDPRLAPYRDLPGSRLDRQELFVAEGSLLVERLLASSLHVVSVLVRRGRESQWSGRLPEGVPLYVADRQLIRDLVGFKFHRGVLACGRRPTSATLNERAENFAAAATVVVCQDLLDPINLGGVLRNCAAFGVDLVLLSPRCAAPFSRRVLRVSMGAVFKVPIVESLDLAADAARLRERHRFELLATVLGDDAIPLWNARRARRVALVLGSEADGISPDLLVRCDHKVTIPMRMGTDSLNVSVASGIFLYHLTRSAPL